MLWRRDVSSCRVFLVDVFTLLCCFPNLKGVLILSPME